MKTISKQISSRKTFFSLYDLVAIYVEVATTVQVCDATMLKSVIELVT
jgi:hypothetical protein